MRAPAPSAEGPPTPEDRPASPTRARAMRWLIGVGAPLGVLGLWSLNRGLALLVAGLGALVSFQLVLTRKIRPSAATGPPDDPLAELPDADRATAVHATDGTVTCACAEGFYVGPAGCYFPVDGPRAKVENIAYEETTHRIRFEVWFLEEVRSRGRVHDVPHRETYFLQLPASLSPEDGLRRAVDWEKRRWQLRFGDGGPLHP